MRGFPPRERREVPLGRGGGGLSAGDVGDGEGRGEGGPR